MTAQYIADLEPARRTAILVAQVAPWIPARRRDTRHVEKYIGSLFTKARSKDERRFQATKRDVAKALLLFRHTIAALKRAKQAGEDGMAAVEREVGMAQLDRALPTGRGAGWRLGLPFARNGDGRAGFELPIQPARPPKPASREAGRAGRYYGA